MEIKIEAIGPETAKYVLEKKNPSNRKIRKRTVKQYASDMSKGKWQITGDPIRYDKDGNLIDGQHRLSAILESGVTIQTAVIYDLERSSQDVIDTGAKRSAANALQMRTSMKNATSMAAIARIGINYERGTFKTTKSRMADVTHSEVVDWVDANYGSVEEIFYTTQKLGKYVNGSVAAMMWAFYHLYTINPVEAKKFLQDLVDLKSGGKGDPRATLYRTLMQLSQARMPHTRTAMTVYAIFKAWNAMRQGKEIHIIADTLKGIDIPKPRP